MAKRNVLTQAAVDSLLQRLGQFAPHGKLASANCKVMMVDGRTRVVFGQGLDRDSEKLNAALTKSFHRAKIAALKEAAQ